MSNKKADYYEALRAIVKLLDNSGLYSEENWVVPEEVFVWELFKVGYNAAVKDMQESLRNAKITEK